jgi:hypothetical protein
MSLLEEAKLKYPVGTKFKGLYSGKIISEIKNHDEYLGYSHVDIVNFYIVDPIGDCNGACVYNNGRWAEIISLPKIKTVKTKKDNYLIKLFKKLKIK